MPVERITICLIVNEAMHYYAMDVYAYLTRMPQWTNGQNQYKLLGGSDYCSQFFKLKLFPPESSQKNHKGGIASGTQARSSILPHSQIEPYPTPGG